MRLTDDSICYICRDPASEKSPCKCEIVVHSKCLRQWYLVHNTVVCTICRSTLGDVSIHWLERYYLYLVQRLAYISEDDQQSSDETGATDHLGEDHLFDIGILQLLICIMGWMMWFFDAVSSIDKVTIARTARMIKTSALSLQNMLITIAS